MATPLGVELLAIVTGPLRMLEPTPKPITLPEVAKAADVEQRVARDMRAWMKQAAPQAQGEEPAERDYFATLKALSKQVDLPARLAVTSLLPDPRTRAEYLAQFDRAQRFLKDVCPRRSYTTLTGQHPAEPSGLELSAFWRAYEAVEDPRVLLRDMREAILVSDQVAVVRQLYPMFYAVMTREALVALAEAKAKGGEDWEPPGWQEEQLEKLLDISRMDPEDMADLQDRLRAADLEDRAETSGQARTVELQDKTADAYQTATQRRALR